MTPSETCRKHFLMGSAVVLCSKEETGREEKIGRDAEGGRTFLYRKKLGSVLLQVERADSTITFVIQEHAYMQSFTNAGDWI